MSARVADLLRCLPQSASVPPTSWNVGETGAHLVTIPRRYLKVMAGLRASPDSMTELNDAELKAVGSRTAAELANELEAGTASLLGELGDDGTRGVQFFGMTHSVAGVGGLMLGEVLVHGRDLAKTIAQDWPTSGDQAVAIMSGVVPTLANFADPDVAARATGVYHLKLRGGPEWTIAVRNGEVSVAPGKPPRADLHISAEPVALMLNGYGRISQARVLASGKIVGWGGKPWLALQFRKLFTER